METDMHQARLGGTASVSSQIPAKSVVQIFQIVGIQAGLDSRRGLAGLGCWKNAMALTEQRPPGWGRRCDGSRHTRGTKGKADPSSHGKIAPLVFIGLSGREKGKSG